jgi:uncharacterized protein YgbK (DUF1537 family)
MTVFNRSELFASMPEPWPDDLFRQNLDAFRRLGRKVVVLDDDPTGTQTVHNIPILTGWTPDALRAEFENDLPAFYILTNSRSMLLADASRINREIGCNLRKAANDREFVVISRSDSTLRGHFPGEVQALADGLEQEFDAWLLIPFFEEGGRLTIEDVHYVVESEYLIPAAETPYASDATFGYQHSNLRDWVEEKTGGAVPASAVASISLQDIRQGGPTKVSERLLGLPKGVVCVVNATNMRDLQVFVAGLLAAEAKGRRYLYRTAASFVAAYTSMTPKPNLSAKDLELPMKGGALFVVGSYVPKTSAQVGRLLELPDVKRIEIQVEMLLVVDEYPEEIQRVLFDVEMSLGKGENVVLYTSRRLITGVDGESSLAIGQRVSSALIKIVESITTRPRYILAKGGITSSDVATLGLHVKRAMVLGQILPGVPVWHLGTESRFPGLVYIVFPGNVGDENSLVEIYQSLCYKGQE